MINLRKVLVQGDPNSIRPFYGVLNGENGHFLSRNQVYNRKTVICSRNLENKSRFWLFVIQKPKIKAKLPNLKSEDVLEEKETEGS